MAAIERSPKRKLERVSSRKLLPIPAAKKSVVLGVTGSIAAYKSAELASLLVKQSHEVAQLAEERENARREKNWKRSDDLRERISALGWEVRDTKDGPKLTRGAGPA